MSKVDIGKLELGKHHAIRLRVGVDEGLEHARWGWPPCPSGLIMPNMGKLRSLLAVVAIVGLLGAPSAARYMDRDGEEPPETEVADCTDEIEEYQQEVKACLEAAEDLKTAKACWET